MKKILTICIFAFTLLISSQGFSQIQQANTVDKANVKENVMKLSNALGLNETQLDAFAQAYMNKQKAIKENNDQSKVEQKFLASLKGILTEDQIAKLKTLNKK